MRITLERFLWSVNLKPGVRLTLLNKKTKQIRTIWVGDVVLPNQDNNYVKQDWLNNEEDYVVLQAKWFTETE